MTSPIIRARGLTKIFGARGAEAANLAADGVSRAEIARRTGATLAVHDIDLEVARGEFFVVMGLSGSGKSTLVRLLNRLIDPTSGTIEIDGEPLHAMNERQLRNIRNHKISMVFQHFALLPHRTVRENASYALKVRGAGRAEQRERADAALASVGLSDWADAAPAELSGGMQQRVGLARALGAGTDVLLMDEPFSALDPLIRRDMQNLLVNLQKELRKTIVFISHDLNEAMRLGDRILLLRDGETVQLGTGAEILAAPANAYVADFVSEVDRSKVLTAADVMRTPRLTFRVGEASADVLRRLAAAEANAGYVLDGGGQVLGVVRDDVVAEQLRAGRRHISDEAVERSFPSTTGAQVLTELLHVVGKHVVPLAVVDDRQRLLGVVPRAAVLDALAAVRG